MRAITGISILAVTLAGCASGAAPVGLSEPSAPARGTPDMDPEATGSATAAPEDSHDAEADLAEFIDVYVQSANLALSDPMALDSWRGMFASSCAICLAGYEAATSAHSGGQTIDGGRLADWNATIQESDGNQAAVLVVGRVEGAVVTDSDGSIMQRYSPVESASVLYTTQAQEDGTWLIISGDLVG